MALFPRIVQVQAGDASEVLNFGALMVEWQFERTADSRGVSGTISLYNLNTESENKIQRRYTDVRLSAGYPDRFGLLLDGRIRDVSRARAGLDRVTHIEIGGKAAATKNRVIDRTWIGGTPLDVIVGQIAAEMGLSVESLGHVVTANVLLEDYSTGSVPAGQALDRLLKSHGLDWYEDNGVIRFRKEGEVGVSKRSVLFVSEATGMIGTPGITEDGLVVRTLIDHRVELDGLVRVRSSFYPDETAGTWKCVAVNQWGDSRDGEAATEMVLRSLGGSIAATPGQAVF